MGIGYASALMAEYYSFSLALQVDPKGFLGRGSALATWRLGMLNHGKQGSSVRTSKIG